jgi:hypothetical protein
MALQDRFAHHRFATAWKIPFECVVTLADDRGTLHEGRVRDYWIVDDSVTPPRWLRSAHWWRSELRRWWVERRFRSLNPREGVNEPPARVE